MIDPAILAALAEAAPRTLLTFTVEAGALAKAMQQAAGGPEWVSTREAVQRHGRSAPYWLARAKEWAAEDGEQAAARAYQEPSGRWFLRSASCREHLAMKAAPASRTRSKLRGPRKR